MAVGGFFAAGEIGPVGGDNHLHGFTAVLLVVDPAIEGDGEVEVSRPVDWDTEFDVARFDEELRDFLGPS
jgi:hypothetical protein